MPLLFGVFTLSAAAIGYEILLTRLLSIVLWHHFAFMIISVALLGVGASGTFLVFARGWLEPRFAPAFAGFSAAFGIAAPGCFALAQRVPFNPLEVVWDIGQQGYLLAVYLLLALPFFCSATAIGLALLHFKERIAAIYRSDLTGAGVGALAVVGGLFLLPEEDALSALCGLGILAGALGAFHDPRARRLAAALVVLALAAPLLWPVSWTAPRPSPYKGLSLALLRPGAQILAERSGPLGRLTVVDSPVIPFRHVPGLSLKATGEPPPQIGVFTDGGAFTAITRFDGDLSRLAYLDQQTAALPFHLLDQPRTLILGAGGGADVLRALYHRAARVDAVEINPRLVELVRRDFGDFAGHIYDSGYDSGRVAVHVGEARRFVEASGRRWDLIQVALLDTFSAAAAGVLALRESTLYTVEAFESYLSRLAPGGMLAVTRWTKVPPRDSLKLFATATEALARRGGAVAAERLVLIRSWNTATLLVKNGAFTPAEVAAVRAFSAARAFDVAYYPGIARDEANRFNRLRAPDFHDGAKALLGAERDRFLSDYKFFLEPATDDRPYFFRFFKWRILPEILAMRGKSGIALLEGGYLILAATLVQAVIASVVLILLPLAWLGRPAEAATLGRGRVVLYFFALGLAFLFVEIAFIQRFILFLGHPLYAISVVLSAFLIFAGLGSGYSARLEARAADSEAFPGGFLFRRPIGLAVCGIAAFAAAYLLLLPALFASAVVLPPALKAGLSILLIAPLAFCMGMPFPLGLRRVSVEAPELLPWAWGVNGCASVLSAVLASLTATHFGFTVVIVLAICLYGAAAYVFRD